MNKNTQIAGKKTVKDWLELEDKINQNFTDTNLWEEAFSFFDIRIKTRYLNPIEAIQNSSSSIFTGEGFAITAIICTLIEAFESFYQGINYKYLKNGEKLSEFEYRYSSHIFVDFLTKREPFKNYFLDKAVAEEFYKNIRCALLHEACTNNGWKIRVDTKKLLEKNGKSYTLNRLLLLQQIKAYIS